MYAVTYRSKGAAAEVLELGDVAMPSPGPGEVRVRLAYAGVNPTDWKLRSAGPPLAYEFQVPGQDGAGVIDAVGLGVPGTRIGQRVWVFLAAHQRPWGTAAEYTVLPANQAVPLPDSVSMKQGAGLGVPYLTAYDLLLRDGSIAGKTVLVAGGAGAVGHAAIELAVQFGARVVTTVSSDAKAELARAAGAHVIVNYTESDALHQLQHAAPEGFDRIIEVAPATNLELNLEVIKQHGVIAIYANEAIEPTLTVRALMMKNVSLEFFMLYFFTPEVIDAGVAEITRLLEAGVLTELPTTSYPLEETAAAHDAVQANAVGKVLIEIAPQLH